MDRQAIVQALWDERDYVRGALKRTKTSQGLTPEGRIEETARWARAEAQVEAAFLAFKAYLETMCAE